MVNATFEQLKMALCEALILALSNFHKVFVLETDTCVVGLGGILSQRAYL